MVRGGGWHHDGRGRGARKGNLQTRVRTRRLEIQANADRGGVVGFRCISSEQRARSRAMDPLRYAVGVVPQPKGTA